MVSNGSSSAQSVLGTYIVVLSSKNYISGGRTKFLYRELYREVSFIQDLLDSSLPGCKWEVHQYSLLSSSHTSRSLQ